MKYILIAAVLVLSFGCSRQPDNADKTDKNQNQKLEQTANASSLIGEWLKPIEGQPDKTDGVKLNKDGSASSVNSATLIYNSWESGNGTLTLIGISVGNGVNIPFASTYQIEKLTSDEMVLKLGESVFTYKRAK